MGVMERRKKRQMKVIINKEFVVFNFISLTCCSSLRSPFSGLEWGRAIMKDSTLRLSLEMWCYCFRTFRRKATAFSGWQFRADIQVKPFNHAMENTTNQKAVVYVTVSQTHPTHIVSWDLQPLKFVKRRYIQFVSTVVWTISAKNLLGLDFTSKTQQKMKIWTTETSLTYQEVNVFVEEQTNPRTVKKTNSDACQQVCKWFCCWLLKFQSLYEFCERLTIITLFHIRSLHCVINMNKSTYFQRVVNIH